MTDGKVLELVSGAWPVVGSGTIRVVKYDASTRLILRLPNGRVVLAAGINKASRADIQGGKNVSFKTLMPPKEPGGTPAVRTFAIRTGSPQLAEKLHAALDAAIKRA